MSRRIVILGGGGDANVIAEAIRQLNTAGGDCQVIGFLDDAKVDTSLVNIPTLGIFDEWRGLDQDVFFIPAIQKVRDMPRRATRIDSLQIPKLRWTSVIHPSAVVARDVDLGIGVYIAASATVQPGCKIGDFATLRAGAAFGHDATLMRHGYVGPNATLCGKVVVCEGAHVGPNAVVLDQLNVGRFSVVGIGSAVTRDVPEFTVVMGNPARRVGRVKGYANFVPKSHDQD